MKTKKELEHKLKETQIILKYLQDRVRELEFDIAELDEAIKAADK